MSADNTLAPKQWGAPDDDARFLFTTRLGGVSVGPFAGLNLSLRVGDDPAAVAENRRRLAAVLPAPPKWLRQVHGGRIICADEAAGATGTAGVGGAMEIEEGWVGDGVLSFSPGVVCGVLTADCLPVLLRAKGDGVCAAHAGWRGLAAGVLENAYAALRARSDAAIAARIGPGISAARYPVGEEVRAALRRGRGDDAFFSPTGGGKFLADLKGWARRRLLELGADEVTTDPACACSDSARYFSARRDGTTGRMAGLVWRE